MSCGAGAPGRVPRKAIIPFPRCGVKPVVARGPRFKLFNNTWTHLDSSDDAGALYGISVNGLDSALSYVFNVVGTYILTVGEYRCTAWEAHHGINDSTVWGGRPRRLVPQR